MLKKWLFFFLFWSQLGFSDVDFQEEMGKNTKKWSAVKTPEDILRIEALGSHFSTHFPHRFSKKQNKTPVPKVLHFVWLGPMSFPEESLPNLEKWIQLHPEWKVKFWTDIKRKAPLSQMEVCSLESFPISSLQVPYFESDNFGEKAKILAYALLFAEGGVYIDHDVTPLKKLDELCSSHSFFCGLEPLGPTSMSSSVIASTHLIGAAASHPIIEKAIVWLKNSWELQTASYPGNTKLEERNRILHRTFGALTEGIDLGLGHFDLVFPSTFFSETKKSPQVITLHSHAEKWASPSFEQNVASDLGKVVQQDDHLLLLVSVLAILSFVGLAFVFFHFRKAFFLLLFFPFFIQAAEFENLMGKETPFWSHVKKKKDVEALEKFSQLYEENKNFRFTTSGKENIPKVVHFIWLGPRAFPSKSVENIRTWIAENPDWTFKFWTDRARVAPCKGMEVCDVVDFPFLFLQSCYEESENWGEKSDILRFEILYREGGVYVDHDANCLTSFDGLHLGYDFYCGLEVPHPPVAGRSITAGNGVIGAKPLHPVVGEVIQRIAAVWQELGEKYRGKDSYSRTQLVMERTYMALTYALLEKLSVAENVDIVLPASYFFAKKYLQPLYSKHFFENSWAKFGEREVRFEKSARRNIDKLHKKNKRIHLIALGALCCNLLALLGGFFYLRRRRRTA